MDIRELHEKAMEIAFSAFLQEKQGNIRNAVSLYEKAFFFEYKAAINAYSTSIGEPSVSILLRSAASLAISCKKFKEAKGIIILALKGDPPSEIAEELIDEALEMPLEVIKDLVVTLKEVVARRQEKTDNITLPDIIAQMDVNSAKRLLEMGVFKSEIKELILTTETKKAIAQALVA